MHQRRVIHRDWLKQRWVLLEFIRGFDQGLVYGVLVVGCVGFYCIFGVYAGLGKE